MSTAHWQNDLAAAAATLHPTTATAATTAATASSGWLAGLSWSALGYAQRMFMTYLVYSVTVLVGAIIIMVVTRPRFVIKTLPSGASKLAWKRIVGTAGALAITMFLWQFAIPIINLKT